MNKITIIGTGNVGATIAYTVMSRRVASEIVMIDIATEKALGEAMDIWQATPYFGACSVYAGDYMDATGSDIVIVTSGVARKPGQSRFDLAQVNVNITKSIIPQITRYAPDAIYIFVSNPVDVLTYAFCKRSGIPDSKVIGSGTMLDTARLRAKMAEIYHINQSNVHAFSFGEHGDSSFVPWSIANISNIPINEYGKRLQIAGKNTGEPDYEDIEKYVRKSGGLIIERKGATYYGVAASVCHICERILEGINTALTVSSMMHGEYGIEDVCLSTLNLIGKDGICGKLNVELTNDELAKLRNSADIIKNVIKSIEI